MDKGKRIMREHSTCMNQVFNIMDMVKWHSTESIDSALKQYQSEKY